MRVLIVGATGHLGLELAKAVVAEGHEASALVRHEALAGKARQAQLGELKRLGVRVVEGSLDQARPQLVKLLQGVDAVVSCVSGDAVAAQVHLIEAAKEAGTVKQFLPSEFGVPTTVDAATLPVLESKAAVRRVLEASGVPYTYVVAYAFAGHWANGLGVAGGPGRVPPNPATRTLTTFGSGKTKFACTLESDIAAYTAKALGDPRALNKALHIRPPLNCLSQHDMAYLWEDKFFRQLSEGTRLRRQEVSAAELDRRIACAEGADKSLLELQRLVTVQGCLPELGTGDVDATTLYPGFHYTPIAKYLNQLVSQHKAEFEAEI